MATSRAVGQMGVCIVLVALGALPPCRAQEAADLPPGVRAVWDADRAWRETTPTRARLQIWYGSVGAVWISNVRMVAIDPPTHGRWLSGLYLDEPVEMDDPYRFFRW